MRHLFYNFSNFTSENLLYIFRMLIATGITASLIFSTFFFFPSATSFLVLLYHLPMVFSTSAYTLLSLSLFYFVYQGFVRAICFFAVISDTKFSPIISQIVLNGMLLHVLSIIFVACHFMLPAIIHATVFLQILFFSFVFSLLVPSITSARHLLEVMDKILQRARSIEQECLAHLKTNINWK